MTWTHYIKRLSHRHASKVSVALGRKPACFYQVHKPGNWFGLTSADLETLRNAKVKAVCSREAPFMRECRTAYLATK